MDKMQVVADARRPSSALPNLPRLPLTIVTKKLMVKKESEMILE
jgi:hypothetical protein